MCLVPYASRPMGGQNFCALDSLYAVFAAVDFFCQVPKIKVDQHAANLSAAPELHDLVPDSLDADDACRSEADLLV